MYQLCNGDLNKFILLLRKGLYPYEDMDSWGKIDETTVPPKKVFYSKLNWQGISDADHAYAQKELKKFGIRNHGEYHDLYAQSDRSLLTGVFINLRDKCNEIYKLDPVCFVSAPGLAWQPCLKKTGV